MDTIKMFDSFYYGKEDSVPTPSPLTWAAAILKIRGIQLGQLYGQLFVYDQLSACHFVSKFQRCTSNGLEMAAF
jgi:hypothetical protein